MSAFQRRYYDGGGTTTTLASSMSASDTSFTITSAANWPGSPGTDFLVVIDRGNGSSEEKILCSSNSGTTVTVATRGYDDTSATTHNASATVSLCGGAIDFDEANQLTNLMGNAAEGSLFYGKGAGTLPSKLAIGSQYQTVQSNGTDPTWAASSTSVLTTTGDLLYASGAHTLARLAVGATSGYVLASNGSTPQWQYPALTTASGNLGSDVGLLTNSLTKVFDTASLAVGTWLVNVIMTGTWGTVTGKVEAYITTDSATATFTGASSTAMEQTGGADGAEFMMSLSVFATVTVAGTLKVEAQNSSANEAYIKAATVDYSYGNATGYTALRVA
jgi:hypothetical protein